MKASLILAIGASSAVASKTSIRLERHFEVTKATDATEVIVKFNVDIAALDAGASKSNNPRQFVHDFLTESARKNEAALARLVPADAKITSLFVGGAAAVSGVTKQVLDELTSLETVTYVDLNADDYTIPEVFERESVNTPSVAGVEWGVQAIEAPEIWKYSTGKGAIVGSVDTGALHTHESIKGNWRSDFGWFDPYNYTVIPWDSSGHGSHTIGTMVGANGIGVAPGAQWISCMGLYKGRGSSKQLLQCAQFMLCPTLPDGTGADCKKGPHVVNQSWGSNSPYNPWMEDAMAAWKAAGIIPVWSNGNNAPACSTVGNPGGYKTVIGVGAMGSFTNEKDKLAFFSSKGPLTTNGPAYIKPDLSAPGFYTLSAGIRNNSHYVDMAGTSMAAPHVSGVVAIIKSIDPTLSYDAVYKYLTATTDQKGLNTTEPATWVNFLNQTVPGAPNCGGVDDTAWPNNRFGHGRVNIGTILRDGKLNDSRRPTC